MAEERLFLARPLSKGKLGRLKIYGFTLLVSLGLAGAALLAGSAAIPRPVPDYACSPRRSTGSREIGAAFFVAFYLVAMAMTLAPVEDLQRKSGQPRPPETLS